MRASHSARCSEPDTEASIRARRVEPAIKRTGRVIREAQVVRHLQPVSLQVAGLPQKSCHQSQPPCSSCHRLAHMHPRLLRSAAMVGCGAYRMQRVSSTRLAPASRYFPLNSCVKTKPGVQHACVYLICNRCMSLRAPEPVEPVCFGARLWSLCASGRGSSILLSVPSHEYI